jgi:regulator of protease activity HflC (stomatin/prohibitin superfamily)
MVVALIILAVLLFSGLRVISQWDRGLIFRFGKFVKELKPGLTWVIPLIDTVYHIDMRIRTMDVVPQEVMTRDSVPTKIDAVVYYQIFDAQKSVVAVENFSYASTLLAQSKLRDVVGKYDLDTLLVTKDKIGDEVLVILQGPTDEWGVHIKSVEIKNIEIPDNMKRAMAKEAEAIREKRARIVKASAEEEASRQLVNAAKNIAESPNALILRQLQTWQEIGAEQNSLIVLVPTEFAKIINTLQNQK